MEQLAARRAHNPKVGGSSPSPATTADNSKELSAFLLFLMLLAAPPSICEISFPDFWPRRIGHSVGRGRRCGFRKVEMEIPEILKGCGLSSRTEPKMVFCGLLRRDMRQVSTVGLGVGGYDRFRFKHPFKQSLDFAVQIHLKPAQEELGVLVSSINARRRVF